MKIVRFKARKGAFANELVEFCPGVNIVRGVNGIGKTTLLEYASLLGHVAIMATNKFNGDGAIKMVVRFSPSDIAFLGDLRERDMSMSADRAFAAALKRRKLSIEQVRESVTELEGKGILGRECVIDFFYPGIREEDLKSVLADEGRIEQYLSVSGDESVLIALKAVNIWLRPTGPKETGPWPATPRMIEDLSAAQGLARRPVPGPVFYFNTDMYDFGSGLDVRESPKHLKENMTQVLLNRLQLVECDIAAVPDEGNVSESYVPEGPERSLLCISRIMDCDEGKRAGPTTGAWERVFTADHPLKSASVVRLAEVDAEGARTADFQWQFQIADRDENSEFLSSGENQALFTLAVLYGLASDGSCMLFDEPELHLTFGAGSRLLYQILKRAKETQSQAIIVTHLPHLYRDQVPRPDWTWDDFSYDKLRMIFIERGPTLFYDKNGVNQAAQSSHDDVMQLIDGLKLSEEDEVRVLPPRIKIRSISDLWKFFTLET